MHPPMGSSLCAQHITVHPDIMYSTRGIMGRDITGRDIMGRSIMGRGIMERGIVEKGIVGGFFGHHLALLIQVLRLFSTPNHSNLPP